MPSFPVVVIGAVNSPRLEYFRTHPEFNNFFEPIYLDAVMLKMQDLSSYVVQKSTRYQSILYGRKLLSQEVGCAISNRRAQIVISETHRGGLILEDDARFKDLTSLIDLVDEFLEINRGQSAILSLFDGRDWSLVNNQFRRNNPFLRSVSSTPHTVAYALTPLAAMALIKANADFKYVADWPPTNCSFYTATLDLISHGDSTTVSSIDPEGIRPGHPDISRRVKVFTGLIFLANRREFGKLSIFLRDMWVPRFKYYVSFFWFRYIVFRNPRN
jgi:GR25 family glycosyltransferase involved in LPS biosynthesis